jgi:hypothetical protein
MKIINISQGSDHWHEERFRSITGTKMQSAIGAKYSAAKKTWTLGDKKVQRTLLLELVSEFQSELEIDDFSNDSMQRGHDLEPYSMAKAEKKLGVAFETCGMLQSDKYSMFKFSPDAICKNDQGVIVGGYETKSKAGKKHIEYMEDDIVPTEHLWQCLCPMIMDDCVEWWSFGHYDDRNHINDLFIKKIYRSEYTELIEQARILLDDFIKEVMAAVQKRGGIYNA